MTMTMTMTMMDDDGGDDGDDNDDDGGDVMRWSPEQIFIFSVTPLSFGLRSIEKSWY